MKLTVKSIFAPLLIALIAFLPLAAALAALAGEGGYVAAENSFVRVQIGKAGTASVTIGKSVLDDYDLKLSARNKSKLDKELPITGGKYVSAFVGNAGNEGDGTGEPATLVLLLKRDGTADYLNVLQCIKNGFSFKVAGTVPLANIVRFQQANFKDNDSYSILQAVTADGKYRDVYSLIKGKDMYKQATGSDAQTAAKNGYDVISGCWFEGNLIVNALVTAGGKTQLAVEENDLMPAPPESKIGELQTVKGTGKYTSVYSGFMGNGGFVYVLLLKGDGSVDFVNVAKCCQNGGNFKAEPVPGLKNVARLETVGDESGSGVQAVTKDGRKLSVDGILGKAGKL